MDGLTFFAASAESAADAVISLNKALSAFADLMDKQTQKALLIHQISKR